MLQWTARLGMLAILGALSSTASAATLDHSGRLLGADDAPAEGTVSLSFRLYDLPSPGPGESARWDSGACPQTIRGGLYAVRLGAGCGASIPEALVEPGTERFLEVSVGGVTLLPRVRLSEVPAAAVAARALNADRIGGKSLSELDARYIAASTLASLARTDAVSPQPGGLNLSGDVSVGGRFVGNGSGLTQIPAGSLVGTIAAASLPTATASTAGILSPVDKQSIDQFSSSGLIGLTGVGSVVVSTGRTPQISIADATSTASGLLSAADKAKLDALTSTPGGAVTGTSRPASPTPGTIFFNTNTRALEVYAGGTWMSVANATPRSCKDLKALTPGATSGVYQIDPDGNPVTNTLSVYCDMTAGGGGWTVAIYPSSGNQLSSKAGYAHFCAQKGLPLSGAGAADASMWLAVKRALYATNHPLTSTWPSGGGSLAMPVLAGSPRALFDGAPVTLPNNITGDSCTSQTLGICGYWYSDGWSGGNLNATPDPEDWELVANGDTQYAACVYRETALSDSRPTSCSDIKRRYSAAASGWYVIDPDGDVTTAPIDVYCDMTTGGGGWTINVFASPGNDVIDSGQAYKNFCTAKGMPLAGKGAENRDVWLAMKRFLHNTEHPLKTSGWPDVGPQMALPILAVPPRTLFDGTAATLPANQLGDYCDSQPGMPCGYWYANGWSSTDLNAYPDPEDYEFTGTYGGRGYAKYFSCVYREAIP